MSYYFAGYFNNKPVVFRDDEAGMVHISHKNRRTISAAHNAARVWNAHVQKKKSPAQLSARDNP